MAAGVLTGGTIVSRFCGVGPSTSTSRALLGGIAAHLACSVALRFGLIFGLEGAADIRLLRTARAADRRTAKHVVKQWAAAARLGNPSKISECLMALLALSTAEHPTIMIVDSVD